MLKILYAVHLLCSRCIENLSALHKDDLLPAVTAYRRCGQSIYVFRTKAFYKSFRSEGRYMMTFVDDKHTINMPPQFYRIRIFSVSDLIIAISIIPVAVSLPAAIVPAS